MPLERQTTPDFHITRGDGTVSVALRGDWTALALAGCHQARQLRAQLHELAQAPDSAQWSLAGVERLDHIGGQLLWQAWNGALPQRLDASEGQRRVFERIAAVHDEGWKKHMVDRFNPVTLFGASVLSFGAQLGRGVSMLGQLTFDLLRFTRMPQRGPWREISANIYNVGYKALGITALVGFLIGIVLSYLSANQLRTFGASTFIVNILGMAVIRELGPVLAAILIAGRSGSAITAQIGVMRVTEELDAMLVMGISHGFRLIMPRVIALAIAMPLLVAWTDVMALAGGILAARWQLGISATFFLRELPDAVPVANLWLGLGKGVVFGILIALTACHFGLRIKPNTQSLGEGTTASVVTAITMVILADAVFAILFKDVGL
ncbi:ABC transport system permease protein slr1045 [Cupriavidus necator N-1]|uniref:ABC transport system permease protein slr1045 n=1 Tax=Cupriavidus necator (strain ATCC 43291 / DSM 13513 / CCUG 52238 / LMG 8453 / N-1) TaxID=1042878 RepID=G0ESM0_CUPNN|nr:ABC transporter permease [Cupriavidus necator]AEI75494.1 ABC transport system permease protein slr1045 [Cupriavidus necator N-1]KAI3608676.1 ABC transporter, permease protein (cluster 9, phospholipid) [Cupriavidus necator H850]MDX6012363.1 ABC transporter permease [Cupriavidus necator]